MESKSSSIYSSAGRSGPDTYLDYSSSIGRSSANSSFKGARDYAEFMSSSATSSNQHSHRAVLSQAASLSRPISTTSSSSRPTSAKPSFMNYNNGAAAKELRRKSVSMAQPPVEAPPPPPREQAGQLLVFVGTEIQQSTLRYVEIALRRKRFSGIAYVGFEEQAAALKQLKMDTYSVIGKMGQEVGVQMQYQRGLSVEAVKMAVEAVVKSAGDVQAVLCSLSYSTPESAGANILDVESSSLQKRWEGCVGFLHAVAKSTIPSMVANIRSSTPVSGFFLVQESGAQDPASLLVQSSVNSLLKQLRETYASAASNLKVGHAANVLVPLPEPINTDGHDKSLRQAQEAALEMYQPEADFGGGESPTKLYSMWAMHESLGEFS